MSPEVKNAFFIPKIKENIKSRIMKGLSDSNAKVRVATAYVISKIAHVDWPENWHGFLDELMSYLKSGHSDSVHGATRVLIEFSRFHLFFIN